MDTLSYGLSMTRLVFQYQGGLEQSKMRFQLDQLFIKGQQERIQRENQEKKQAAQIAAGMYTE